MWFALGYLSGMLTLIFIIAILAGLGHSQKDKHK